MIMLPTVEYSRVQLVKFSLTIVVVFCALCFCVIFLRMARGLARSNSSQPLGRFSGLAGNSLTCNFIQLQSIRCRVAIRGAMSRYLFVAGIPALWVSFVPQYL